MRSLFLTGLVQVYFVAINTYFISKSYYVGAFIVSFIISLIWSFNVKRIAFGRTKDRLLYAAGAALGTALGMITSHIIIKTL